MCTGMLPVLVRMVFLLENMMVIIAMVTLVFAVSHTYMYIGICHLYYIYYT